MLAGAIELTYKPLANPNSSARPFSDRKQFAPRHKETNEDTVHIDVRCIHLLHLVAGGSKKNSEALSRAVRIRPTRAQRKNSLAPGRKENTDSEDLDADSCVLYLHLDAGRSN